MQTTLEGSRAKLRRAKEHLDHLEAEITKFLNPDPYKVAVERAANNLFVVRVAEVPESIPIEDWALVIGDCVHNMRAALDYIAWQLAGSDLNDRTTLFPIFDTVGGWNANSWKRIRRLPPCARAMIKDAQPCFTAGGNHSALNGLRIFDDADKHKLLTPTAVVHDKVHLDIKNSNKAAMHGTRMEFFELPLDYGTVLATIVLPDFAPPQVEVEARFTPAIAFSDRLTGRRYDEVIPSLRNIFRDVTILVNNFDGKFFAGYGRVYAYAPSRAVADKWNQRAERRVREELQKQLPPVAHKLSADE